MKLTNLKIGTQLRLSFCLILLLIFIMGGVSWLQSTRLAKQTTDLFQHPHKVSITIGELKSDVLLMQRGMNGLYQAENASEESRIIQEIDVCKIRALKRFDLLYERYLGPRTDIDDAFNSFVKWNTIRDETVLLLREGKLMDAKVRTQDNGIEGQHVEQLLGKIQKISVFAGKKGNEFYQKAIVLNKTFNGQLLIGFICILLIITWLVYFLIRSIHRPLTELEAATQLFKEGKMDARCSYVSDNEFGTLAVSFNNLAETLETEYKLNTKAANLARMMLSVEDAHKFCHSLLSALIEDTWSQMGAVYLLNDDKTKFEVIKCVGMSVAGCKPFSATQPEGEFGLAISTKEIQYIKNIPEDSRFKFATVIGEFMPREIITIPIITSNEVVAVISLSNIKRYSKSSLRLLNAIHDMINARMGGILAYRKITAFSQRLEYQNIELESQKSELSAQTSELVEQNIELEMQKNQLDETNKLKTIFLSNMSHELRTPLNSVIALSGVLNRRLAGKVPEEEYSYLDVIERNGRSLLLLINDILDLSRIESGREEVEITNFNISSLIVEVVEMIKPQAVQKNIDLRYLSQDLHPLVTSDYEKTRHILQNLVGNAVKFTEDGHVEITAYAKDETMYVSVVDTGIGINKENLSQIFDEFKQADGSNSRKYGGTGLGLAIAKKYAEMLGGSIEVESYYGKGSRFTLDLPLRFDGQQMMEDQDYKPTINNSEKFIGQVNPNEKTILLVEDTEAVVIQMKDMLESQGYNMQVARNGREALDLISEKIPDGLILDLMMPGVDGFEVLKCIREDQRVSELPVIILTAKYITKEELSFLKHNNIHQLIHKGDINKEQLLEAVASMVYNKTTEAQEPQKRTMPIRHSGTPRVLVVEDNPDNMLTIKALLNGKCEILEAEDGLTGIIMAKEHQPHLILMDIALPGINGIEALIRLRKDTKLKDIPVIAVSASAMKGDREEFIARGFDDYISKPIENEHFIQVINAWIVN